MLSCLLSFSQHEMWVAAMEQANPPLFTGFAAIVDGMWFQGEVLKLHAQGILADVAYIILPGQCSILGMYDVRQSVKTHRCA